jgi:tetratricopeptide (TPR) repeat protein
MNLQPDKTMKLPTIFLTVLLGIFFIAPDADARGDKRDGGGRSKASAPKRSGGGSSAKRGGGDHSAKRSPMTGSKIERPKAKPQPRPVSRPESRPTARPEARPAQRPEFKPSQRPSVQKPSVQKPGARPETLPGNLPDRRPEFKPGGNRPESLPSGVTRPGGGGKPGFNRPETLPGNIRPDKRPSLERPGTNRPTTLPGMVSYPNRPDKGKPGRPNIGNDRINIGDRNKVHIDKVNIGRRNVGLNRPSTLPARTRDWDNNRWGGNRGVWGNNNDININIDNNFRYNNNFSYRPNYWGARPWWGAGHCHHWHHGHWGYGWNSSYYRRHWWYDDDDDDFARGFMWGIGVWSLGNLIYDMGYQSYRNPYPAPRVQNTYVTYAQPVSVAAAANPPGDEQATQLAETKSNEALERSRAAFKQGDYPAASKAVDEAIAQTPGDVTLHEYRALVFFALGKYSDAAGVLNPVLASGPGWSWDTMVGFYDNSGTYSGQLRKLEAYAKGAPDKADARFLLGYHYMVCGHMEKANEEFSKAVELQPADSISRQLRDLTKSSIPDAGDSDAEPPARPAPVSPDQLPGTWVSDRGADGKVTFTMTPGGDYTWAFMNNGQTSELKGTYGLNDKGLLVLTSDDTQMVSAIEMKDASKLHFTLVGAPDGDPGLEFVKN